MYREGEREKENQLSDKIVKNHICNLQSDLKDI